MHVFRTIKYGLQDYSCGLHLQRVLLPMTSWTMMPLSPPTVFMEALHWTHSFKNMSVQIQSNYPPSTTTTTLLLTHTTTSTKNMTSTCNIIHIKIKCLSDIMWAAFRHMRVWKKCMDFGVRLTCCLFNKQTNVGQVNSTVAHGTQLTDRHKYEL